MLQVWLQRARPDVLLVAIRGDDQGELGHRPLAEIEAAMGPEPMELFLDLRQAVGATSAVRDLWTAWFERRHDDLRRVHVLTASPHVNLAVEAARILTRRPKGELIRIHQELDSFVRAFVAATGRREAPPAPPGDAVLFATAGCAFVYRRLSPTALLIEIEGTDRGDFGDATFQEIERSFAGAKVELFVDTRATRAAGPTVSNAWGAWMGAHRADLSLVHVLAGSKQVALALAVVQHLQRLGDVMRLYTDPVTFEREVARARAAHVQSSTVTA